MYQLGNLIASLPPSGWTQANLIAPLAKLGWDSLGHPPISYLGDEWQYHSAYGSHNVCHLGFVCADGRTFAIRILASLELFMPRASSRLISTPLPCLTPAPSLMVPLLDCNTDSSSCGEEEVYSPSKQDQQFDVLPCRHHHPWSPST